jgi:hypothetical protein
MFRRIDRSPFLARLIASVSEFMARRRGLPVVCGIALVIISFVLQLFDVYVDSTLLQLCAVVTLNGGILIALIGLVLAQPLGK